MLETVYNKGLEAKGLTWSEFPATTIATRSINADTTLSHRLQRWHNIIISTLGEWLVAAGLMVAKISGNTSVYV